MMAGRDEMLARFLYCLGWTMRKEGKEENAEKARYLVEQAFFLANFFRLPHLSHEINKYYDEEWHKKIT